jgi:hypothetical protein
MRSTGMSLSAIDLIDDREQLFFQPDHLAARMQVGVVSPASAPPIQLVCHLQHATVATGCSCGNLMPHFFSIGRDNFRVLTGRSERPGKHRRRLALLRIRLIVRGIVFSYTGFETGAARWAWPAEGRSPGGGGAASIADKGAKNGTRIRPAIPGGFKESR